MLQKYKYTESDFELSILDFSRLGFIRKNVKKFSPFFFNFNLLNSFCFLFCNIINIDNFLIHRFLLVFWLFTGSFGSVINLKINLRLGVHYYHFMIQYVIRKRKFYHVLSFLIDAFLGHQRWSGYKVVNNSYIFFFDNLEILTNYKLARGVYFHRIQQKLFLKLSFENILSYFFNVYLTSLKLYVI